MSSPPRTRFTFGQLSVGLQIILILVLVGSCSGASNNSVTNPSVDDEEVVVLQEQVDELSTEVKSLRGEVRLLRRDLRPRP